MVYTSSLSSALVHRVVQSDCIKKCFTSKVALELYLNLILAMESE